MFGKDWKTMVDAIGTNREKLGGHCGSFGRLFGEDLEWFVAG
jgi:hypothetical protein